MRNAFRFAAAVALAAGAVTYAQAAPLVPAAPPGELDPIVRVHGSHALCELGPAGWHYHLGPRATRVACAPNPGAVYIWRCEGNRCGWWHPLLFRWH